MRGIVILCLILVFMASPSFSDIHIGLSAGYLAPGDPFSSNFNAGFSPTILVNVDDLWDGLGLRGSIGYYSVAHKTISGRNLTLVPIHLSAIYSIAGEGPILGYIGAGFSDCFAYDRNGGTYINAEKNLGYHFLTGLGFSLSKASRLYLEVVQSYATLNSTYYNNANFSSLVINFGYSLNLTPQPPSPERKVVPEPRIYPPLRKPTMPLRIRLEEIEREITIEESAIAELLKQKPVGRPAKAKLQIKLKTHKERLKDLLEEREKIKIRLEKGEE